MHVLPKLKKDTVHNIGLLSLLSNANAKSRPTSNKKQTDRQLVSFKE